MIGLKAVGPSTSDDLASNCLVILRVQHLAQSLCKPVIQSASMMCGRSKGWDPEYHGSGIRVDLQMEQCLSISRYRNSHSVNWKMYYISDNVFKNEQSKFGYQSSNLSRKSTSPAPLKTKEHRIRK